VLVGGGEDERILGFFSKLALLEVDISIDELNATIIFLNATIDIFFKTHHEMPDLRARGGGGEGGALKCPASKTRHKPDSIRQTIAREIDS
jgi:hypothetical protein